MPEEDTGYPGLIAHASNPPGVGDETWTLQDQYMLLTSESFLLSLKMQISCTKGSLTLKTWQIFQVSLWQSFIYIPNSGITTACPGIFIASVEKPRLLINFFSAKGNNNLLLLLIVKRTGTYSNTMLYSSFRNSLETIVLSPQQLCSQGNRGDTVCTSFLTTSQFTLCILAFCFFPVSSFSPFGIRSNFLSSFLQRVLFHRETKYKIVLILYFLSCSCLSV